MRWRPSQVGLINNTLVFFLFNWEIGRWRSSKGEDSGVRRSSPVDPLTGIMFLSSLCTQFPIFHLWVPLISSKTIKSVCQLTAFFMCRWDRRSSAVTPDEDVFYLVALLRSALDNGEETQSLEYLSNQNDQILAFCSEEGIEVKQYLPHYTTEEEWAEHFGDNWAEFRRRKMKFDPGHILATGQRIFPLLPSNSVNTAAAASR